MSKIKLAGTFFTLARKTRDLEVLFSFDPKKIFKRFVVHKTLGKSYVKKLMNT